MTYGQIELEIVGYDDNALLVRYPDKDDEEFRIPSQREGTKQALYMRRYRELLKDDGRCPRCRGENPTEYATCDICRETFRKMRERFKTERKCVHCGSPLDNMSLDKESTICTFCSEVLKLNKLWNQR